MSGTEETVHRSPSPTVETEIPVCAECAEKSLRLDSLQGRIAVMDAELMKLRRRVMEEQEIVAKEKEEALLALRTLRQLLITYLTSVRGGAALKALMEQLKLSEEEQRVCVLKEVEKFEERKEQSSLLSWLGGIAMSEEVKETKKEDSKESVTELWNKLFQYEQSVCACL
ncbi:uncharacterized protein [Blastocystis hominis]|uniref:Uncharacterized protein n=1 Tax=Blastocystis hominis TaxID=12968 RepID=D8LZC0_BLAHO|nr:uncharacterized protein [Blastocystis hominis]CBK21159.2 unnamed protein product [Blastocystis hominis]|eukprot:XP_012895207.1 uncharacterized protein [Blastocystis hominis]